MVTLSAGTTICFTGKAQRPRSDMVTLATAAGLQVTNDVTRASVLVVGMWANGTQTTKTRKAVQAGTPTMIEGEFLRQIKLIKSASIGAAPPPPDAQEPPSASEPTSVVAQWKPTPSKFPCAL